MSADQATQFTCERCGARTVGTWLCRECHTTLHTHDPAPIERDPAPTPAPPPQRDIRVLRLQPGDVLIMRTPTRLSQIDQEGIRQQVEKQFPGHKCLVLTDGLELDIAREMGGGDAR